jgi:spectrin alpha
LCAVSREKKLLVGSDDYGRDLTGVQNLRKKHKRLDTELASHEPQVQLVREKGEQLMATSNVGRPEIEQRMLGLEQSWNEIRALTGNRFVPYLQYTSSHPLPLSVTRS